MMQKIFADAASDDGSPSPSRSVTSPPPLTSNTRSSTMRHFRKNTAGGASQQHKQESFFSTSSTEATPSPDIPRFQRDLSKEELKILSDYDLQLAVALSLSKEMSDNQYSRNSGE
jgi:hypothetical protein